MSEWVYTSYGSISTYYSWTGLNTENQVGSPIVFPKSGKITKIDIHGAGYNATAYAFHCLWADSGSLLGKTDTVTWANSASRSWQEGTCSINVSAGTTYWIGFWANPNYSRQWSHNGSGTNEYRVTSTGGVSSLTGGKYYSYYVCACAYLEPTAMKVWNGSSWVDGTVKVWNGSSWVDPVAIKVWNGSSWVNNA